MADTPQLAQGEFLRYFAEAAWYPTAPLPSQGVRWEAVDGGHTWVGHDDEVQATILELLIPGDRP